MKLSIVLPIHNEGENLERLLSNLFDVLRGTSYSYEILAIDDGSKDNSFAILQKIARGNKCLKVVSFQTNFGQTAAISAGINLASGDIIIPMDSDGENDPRDIPLLISKINEGYDVVSGWRQNRWTGQFLTRKIPSLAANWLISKITGIKLHDYGCTLKAYKREVIIGVRLYGEMHRFVPAYASWKGARVAELPVHYSKRMVGKSHYGLSRVFAVILDLVVIKFLDKYMTRPMHFFGGLGFISLAMGFIAGVSAIVLRLLSMKHIVETPLPILAALFIIVGVQMIGMGMIAEILMRTYYESQDKKPYYVREKINF